jgi:hypothetical protein
MMAMDAPAFVKYSKERAFARSFSLTWPRKITYNNTCVEILIASLLANFYRLGEKDA